MSDARHPLSRLLNQMRDQRGAIILASICSVLNKIWDLAPPVLIGMAIDVVHQQEESFLADYGYTDPWVQLQVLAGITVAIWVLESLFQYFYGVLWRNLAQTAQHELRMDAYRHIQDLEMQWFSEQSTGGLMAIMNDDVNQLERFLDHGANDLLQVGTTVIVVSGIMFYLAPEVALLAIIPVPVIVGGSFLYQRRIGVRYTEVRKEVAELNAILNNNLQGITTIKSFTAEEREAEGKIGLGEYSVIVFITQRLLWPLTRLGETFDLYQRALASTTRVLDLLDTEVGVVEGDTSIEEVEGDIRFEDIRFTYPGREDVLRGIDLEVPAGKTVGLVGATGSGKTTLVRLLLRFHDPLEGKVSLDGHDVRTLKLDSLRGSISLVSQTTTLFPGTVRDNVLYGRPDASEEEMVEAASIAEAIGFIDDLPEGWDTNIGEDGHRLSGGQRQRIAIARAVLKDAPVLVLDEATSNVDNETEAALQRSIERISRDRTTLIIAHRLSTIRNADTIAVMEKGQITEAGSHDELVSQEGLYARLWAVQTGEASE